MGTVAYLDVSRSQLVEVDYSGQRRAVDITLPSDGKKSTVWKYPHTSSIILQPINLMAEFQSSASWEALKFRLTDVTYPKDWFVDIPMNTRPDTGPSDYFMAGVVIAQNVASTPPAPNAGNASFLFSVTNPVFDSQSTLIDMPNQENITNGIMMSNQQFPANQGYALRFFCEGRAPFARTCLYDFFFGGGYRLRLFSSGTAELWQATDASRAQYTQIYQFNWTQQAQVHDRWHMVVIAPHGRRYIEFMTRTSAENLFGWRVAGATIGPRGVVGGGVYEIPGNPIFDGNGNPIVTQADNWSMAVSREFKPCFQVSRWAYYNGTNPMAQFYDHPMNVPFGATAPIWVQPDGDLNGGQAACSLLDASTGQPYQATTGALAVQFGLQMQGIGDIAGPGLASSTTPELYGYSLRKEAVFQVDNRLPGSYAVQRPVTIDYGDVPDGEHMSIKILNSENQVQAFTRRGDIPVLVGDPDTNINYFEGSCVSVISGESPDNDTREVTLDCHGMATQLLSHEWNENAPDFGKDPYDVNGQAWYWQNASAQAFASGGFDPATQVYFEDGSNFNFRLWMDGDAGGTTTGFGQIGTDNNALQVGSRWKPPRGMNIYEWQVKFLRNTFGWEFHWDRYWHRWTVYRRPDPRTAYDVGLGKFVPKIAFYRNQKLANQAADGLPSYAHKNFHTETERPAFNTLIVSTVVVESALPNRQALADQLLRVQQGQADPGDTAFVTQPKNLDLTYQNTNSYGPNASLYNNPDYLGHLSVKRAYIPRAPTREALDWMGRRLYEDNCFGWVKGHLDSYWGDVNTAYLRKYDVVLVDSGLDTTTGIPNGSTEPWYIYRIEPSYQGDNVMRARYQLRLYRPDARPPR